LAAWVFLAQPARALIDTNGNFMSDPWERAFNDESLFGAEFGRFDDPDGDGWTNEEESVAGTDPRDPYSPDGLVRPEIIREAPQGVFTIIWPTVPGVAYQLQCNDSLAPSAWVNVGAPALGDGTPVSDNVEVAAAQNSIPMEVFWRVKVFATDEDGDGYTNHEEHLLGTNPRTSDSDHDLDGIPDGYDRDLWPQAQYPSTWALLGNVLINEVMHSNDFTAKDDDGDSQDWIELYNPTNDPVDLTGWHLSDKWTNPTKWTFPSGTVIGSGRFLVIWASGKNRGSAASGDIHNNFSLANNPAEPVVLSNPQGVNVDSYRVDDTAWFGNQQPDVSFGRYATASGLQTGYMDIPTPGARGPHGPAGMHNGQGYRGFSEPPVFAGSAGGLQAGSPATVSLVPPASGGVVRYTLDSSAPTATSAEYGTPLSVTGTTIVRAVNVRADYLPSASVTRSFLFKDDILGTAPQGTPPDDCQGARDSRGRFIGLLHGYPERTSEGAAWPLLYGMEPQSVAAHKNTLLAELDQVPVVSLVCPVEDFFDVDTGGLYANSGLTGYNFTDPRRRDWERACSLEVIEPGGTNRIQANAAVTISGASSISQCGTRKHNLRFKFDETYGRPFLQYFLYPGFNKNEFTSFILKNPTHDSWSVSDPGFSVDHRDQATYCRETWVAETHRAMGHEAPLSRWCHLFINGIYWGPYEIIERVDDGFMKAHFGDGVYDVVRDYGDVVSGNNTAWLQLNAAADAVLAAPPEQKAARCAELAAQIDVRNFVDYLVCQTYAFNTDWVNSNWRAGRKREAGQLWRFFIWDAEYTMGQGSQQMDPELLLSSNEDGPWKIHTCLKDYPPYRDLFSARLHWHFEDHSADDPVNNPNGDPATSGTLMLTGPRPGPARFQAAMDRFAMVVFSESARWGNMAKTIPYTKSDPAYQPGLTRGDWDRSTYHLLNTWLPARQNAYLPAMQNLGLYQP
jgi:hypothetical protein